MSSTINLEDTNVVKQLAKKGRMILKNKEKASKINEERLRINQTNPDEQTEGNGEINVTEQQVIKRSTFKLTGYNMFQKSAGRCLPNDTPANLGEFSKICSTSWKKIDSEMRKDWNNEAQKMREDHDCGLVESSFKCNKCQKEFRKEKEQRFHEKFCNMVKCVACDKEFSCLLLLRKHQPIHTESNKCDVCTKVFVSKQALARHKNIHIGKKENCNICSKTFTTLGNLKRHVSTTHK